MQATEYGLCPESASVWWRGPDRRSVGRLEVECAVWPRSVVVRRVFHQDEPEVPLVHNDQVVQTLPSQRPDEALGDRVRLRCLHRRQDGLDADPGGARDEGGTVATVTVAEEVLRLVAPRRGGDELAPDPVGGRMCSHIEVDEPPSVMGDEEEHEERVEGNGLHGEEVGGPNVWCVIAEEGAPGLRRRAAVGDAAVAADRFSTDLEAQLSELTLNPHAPPAGVLASEALNEQSELWGEAWPTRSAASALPGPVASLASAVPADYGVGLDEDERGAPGRPDPREPRPEQAVRGREARSPGRASEHSELLPQGEVLQGDVASRAYGSA